MISLHTYMFLNCYHPTSKFTAEYSRTKTNFLLDAVMKKGNRLVSDLKPTDTHQYLYASLCHVSHTRNAVADHVEVLSAKYGNML